MKNTQVLGRTLFAILMVFALMLTSCKPSTVVSALENVVGLAEIAIPVIGSAAGLSTETQTAIVKYLQLVLTAAMEASDELAHGGSVAQIISLFTGLAAGCNCIPAGTPANIVNVLDAVAKGVAQFLSQFGGVTTTAKKAALPKLNPLDATALTKIRIRAEQDLAKLQGLQK